MIKICDLEMFFSKTSFDTPEYDIAMVAYELEHLFRSKLFNHKKFLESFDINIFFIQNAITVPCHYLKKLTILQNVNMVTSLVTIIWHGHNCRNKRLRKVITKGPKYREASIICWDRAKSSIIGGMNGVVKQFSNRLNINKI